MFIWFSNILFLRYGRSTMNAANGTPVLQATCGLGQHLNGLSEDNRSECPCHLFHLQIHFFFQIRNTSHFTNTQQTFLSFNLCNTCKKKLSYNSSTKKNPFFPRVVITLGKGLNRLCLLPNPFEFIYKICLKLKTNHPRQRY